MEVRIDPPYRIRQVLEAVPGVEVVAHPRTLFLHRFLPSSTSMSWPAPCGARVCDLTGDFRGGMRNRREIAAERRAFVDTDLA